MAELKNELVAYSEEEIINKIHVIRSQKVMLDRDLAEMYGASTFRLNEAVKRNSTRFPDDFMFQLTAEEFKNLTSQIAMSSWGGIRRPPFAFTEQGVAMLSSVLRSETAIQVNISIIRVYTKMKKMLLGNKDIWNRLEQVEQALERKNEEVKSIFNILKQLLIQETRPKESIGFKISKSK